MATVPVNEADSNSLPTGSLAEFYIQPMLTCVGDIDIMHHRCDMLAIPHDYPPPSQLPAEFDSRVKVCEIIDASSSAGEMFESCRT